MTWCAAHDMMALALVSRSFKAMAASPSSWSTVDLGRASPASIRSLFKLFPLALRAATHVTIGEQVWRGLGAWQLSNLFRFLCADSPPSGSASLAKTASSPLLSPTSSSASSSSSSFSSRSAPPTARLPPNDPLRDFAALQPRTRLVKLEVCELGSELGSAASDALVRLCPNLTDLSLTSQAAWGVKELQHVMRHLRHLAHLNYAGRLCSDPGVAPEAGPLPAFVVPSTLETVSVRCTHVSSSDSRYEIVLEGSVHTPSRIQTLQLIAPDLLLCTAKTVASLAIAPQLADVRVGVTVDDAKHLDRLLSLPVCRRLTLSNVAMPNYRRSDAPQRRELVQRFSLHNCVFVTAFVHDALVRYTCLRELRFECVRAGIDVEHMVVAVAASSAVATGHLRYLQLPLPDALLVGPPQGFENPPATEPLDTSICCVCATGTCRTCVCAKSMRVCTTACHKGEEKNARCRNHCRSADGGDVAYPAPPASVVHRPMAQVQVWIRVGSHRRCTALLIPRCADPGVQWHLAPAVDDRFLPGVAGAAGTARFAASLCHDGLEQIVKRCGCVLGVSSDPKRTLETTGPDFPAPVACALTQPCPNSSEVRRCLCSSPPRAWNVDRSSESSLSSSSSSSSVSAKPAVRPERPTMLVTALEHVFDYTHYVQSTSRHREMFILAHARR